MESTKSNVVVFGPTFLLFVFFVNFSATCFGQGWLNSEKDEALGTQRTWVELSNTFYANRSSKGNLTQTFLKEKKDSISVYAVFDVLKLDGSCFDIEKDVFVLVDDVPYRLNVLKIERSVMNDIKAEHSKVLQGDSSTVSVMSGYQANSFFVVKTSYQISPQIIDKIAVASKVAFRYYSGPYMLTAKLTSFDVSKLQRLIQKA